MGDVCLFYIRSNDEVYKMDDKRTKGTLMVMLYV